MTPYRPTNAATVITRHNEENCYRINYALLMSIEQVFEGNANSHAVKHSYLDEPIIARFIRFQTVHWNQHPSMRVEIIGCQGNHQSFQEQLTHN